MAFSYYRNSGKQRTDYHRGVDREGYIGSGSCQCWLSAAVIALAEETAWRSVAAFLELGQGTVGMKLNEPFTIS